MFVVPLAADWALFKGRHLCADPIAADWGVGLDRGACSAQNSVLRIDLFQLYGCVLAAVQLSQENHREDLTQKKSLWNCLGRLIVSANFFDLFLARTLPSVSDSGGIKCHVHVYVHVRI